MTVSGNIPVRSDIRTSLERITCSGRTAEQERADLRRLGYRLAKRNILLIDINDAQHTVSQTDRAAKLKRELYPEPVEKSSGREEG